jgi:uncharacterized protein YjbI with pentapeptide repeats
MTEPKKNQNDQPTEEQKPSDDTQDELREISDEELSQILEDHKKWVETEKKEGKKADLSKVNLKNTDLLRTNLEKPFLILANLKKANLTKANLQEGLLLLANLQDADLSIANLQQAHLGGAKLEDAKLTGTNFQQANLSKANLQKADLTIANLQQANLSKTNLQQANLSGINLHNADLSKADLQNTTLDDVEGLSEANLQYTNFEGATGLLGNEFAQADVTGAKLPDDIKEFKALETVKETSQNARKIFFAMLLGCVYSWLTIATTTDVRLLTNTASSPLPIIGTEIPIAWFYIAAPLVLICLYFYFHLYLDNLWGALASLPAIFPDGKRLDERAYPWLLNTLVRRHFKRLKSRPLIARMKEWITIFLAWLVVPFTMMAFWFRYIPRHDWIGTIFHVGLIVLSVAFAIIFYRLCALTLQGKEKVEFRLRNFWKDRRIYYCASLIATLIILVLISYGAIHAVILQQHSYSYVFSNDSNIIDIRKLVPKAFEKIGYKVYSDFSEETVSEMPDNYWELNEKNRLQSVIGANLRGRNLKNANMASTFLVKADLRKADLRYANIQTANLRRANLEKANLMHSYLYKADLQNTVFDYANLRFSSLIGANLQNASLNFTNLSYALFNNADLQNASLEYSNLQNAQL